MTYSLTNKCAKNYYNRALIVQVIAESVVTCFFLRHSVVCFMLQCYYFGSHGIVLFGVSLSFYELLCIINRECHEIKIKKNI